MATHNHTGISFLGANGSGLNRAKGASLDVVRKAQVAKIAFSDGTGENSTGIVLPAKAIVREVFIHVTTAEAVGATKTLTVGPTSTETGGDADGYIAGVSVAATGTILPGVTFTVGASETFVASTTFGVLLGTISAGNDVATDVGTFVPKFHVNNNGNTISWTPGSADWTAFAGELYVVYDEIVTA